MTSGNGEAASAAACANARAAPALASARTRMPSPVAVLKAISCYEYQSCEHPGWHTSEARQFCSVLRDHMISMLPGYDDAQWEID